MSAEIQSDVAAEYREARQEIESAMNSVLSSFDYGDGLKKVRLIGIVRETDDPTYCETNKYRKKERVFDSRLKISHAEFKAATAIGKRKLIVGIVLRAIEELRRRRIPNIDFAKLAGDVRELAAVKGWA